METPAEGWQNCIMLNSDLATPRYKKLVTTKGGVSMALYHFCVQIISRANGGSACAAIAYRSAEKIENPYDGITRDYRRKNYVIDSVVLLPSNAPSRFEDRAVLWGEVELNEVQKNAQLCREINFCLPREVSPEVQKQIALEFIQEQFVDRGMIADVCFHNPPRRPDGIHPVDSDGNITNNPDLFVYDNPHAHAMFPLRSLDSEGNWESKKQKLYVCEKDGIQKLFSAKELKDVSGWEKLYHYENENGIQSWHTKSYAEQHPEECKKLLNRYPKCEQRMNETVEEWNSPETLMQWREAWAAKVNAAYEAAGLEFRVDHRSYEEQGLELIPTVHEGKFITQEERRLQAEYNAKIARGEKAELIHTDVRNLNLAIREHNKEVKILAELRKLQAKMDKLVQPVVERLRQMGRSIAEQLETLRIDIILSRVSLKEAVAVKGTTDEKIKSHRKYICDLAPARIGRVDALLKQVESTKKQLSASVFPAKKESLQERLLQLQREFDLLENNSMYADKAMEEMVYLQETSDLVGTRIKQIKKKIEEATADYQNLENSVAAEDMNTVEKERAALRENLEGEALKSISRVVFYKEAEKVDEELDCTQMNVEKLDDGIKW